jgi:hypothetical protein
MSRVADDRHNFKPKLRVRHNSKPDESKHPSQESNHGFDTICWEIKAVIEFLLRTH